MTESAAQPLYKYIKDDIVRQIKDGIYKPDQCLPSERDFCLVYGTTPDIAEQVTYVDDLTGSAAYKKYLAGIVFTLGR